MSWSALAPGLIGAGIVAILWLERRIPYDRGQRFLREGFWTDLLGHTLFQGYLAALVIGALIRWLDATTGLSRLALVSDWPVGLQAVFFVVSHDLYTYWFHRWEHASPLLWRLHETHHSPRTLDLLASTRSHLLEVLINQTIEFAPMVLLGAHPEVPLIKATVSALWGMWIHSNVDVRSGRLQWILNGPEAHRWHHAVDAEAYGRNLATKLAVWDRLFGTAYLPRGRKPSGYGLPGFPHGYLAQQLRLFGSTGKPAPTRAAAPAACAAPDNGAGLPAAPGAARAPAA